MLTKMIVLIAVAFIIAVTADHLGIIHISVQKEKPKVLEIRDEYVLKSLKSIDPKTF